MTFQVMVVHPVFWIFILVLMASIFLRLSVGRTSKKYISDRMPNKTRADKATEKYFAHFGLNIPVEPIDNLYDCRYLPENNILVAGTTVCHSYSVTGVSMMLKTASRAKEKIQHPGLYKFRSMVYAILYWMTYLALVAILVGGILQEPAVILYGGMLPFIVLFFYSLLTFLLMDLRVDNETRHFAVDQKMCNLDTARSMIATLSSLSLIEVASTFMCVTMLVRGIKFLLVGTRAQNAKPLMTPDEREAKREELRQKQSRNHKK